MKKHRIASVFLLTVKKVRIYVLIDTHNNVVKFHIDYPVEPSEAFQKEVESMAVDFAKRSLIDSMFDPTIDQVSKKEVFDYLPKTFVK